MRKVQHSFEFAVKVESELSESETLLVRTAKEMTDCSYAPYSNFRVGAALLLEDGTVVCGTNQENCAYPSGICAERTAVFYANSQYPNMAITAICIAARQIDGKFTPVPISPCGMCRQVLIESEQRQRTSMRIILYGSEEIFIVNSARELLPLQFGQSFLRDTAEQ